MLRKDFVFLQCCLLPFWLAGAFMLFGVASSFLSAKRSESFASVVGEVIESEVRTIHDSEDGDRHAPKLRYRYEVAGQTYEADRVMSGNTYLTGEQVRTWSSLYPVGTKIRVYFDAKTPSDATLVRGASADVYALALFTALWIVMLITFSSFSFVGLLGKTVAAIEVVSPASSR